MHRFFVTFATITFLGAASGGAQTQPAPPADWVKQVKNPVDWLNWGGDFRLRNEYFNDAITLNPNARLHEQDYFRFRARLWATVSAIKDIDFNVRMATEPREWLNPAGYTPMAGRTGTDWTEGVVDNLNVKWKQIGGLPLTAIVGRQDILLGEGWLTGDGTPFDGSWTYFLDAARFTYDLKDQHTTIDIIGIVQDARDDGWMPTLNNQDRFETEQNEKGAILYVSNTSYKPVNVSGYFIYKHDNAANGIAAKFHADSGDIYTIGSRLSGLVGDHWKYSAEGAYQFGEKQDPSIQFPSSSREYRDIRAFGVNDKVAYLFNDRLKNQLNFSYEFLSGDDPNTKNDEMFDNLWGRWPRWSELGLYTFAAETRIGQEANMHRIGPGWVITPMKDLDFSANYFALFSEQQVATRGPGSLFSGSGNFRGHFAQAIVRYKFNKYLSGHVWSEVEFPGDYYVHKAPITFLRGELMFIF